MSLKYLLDTNIVIYTMKNRPPEVRSRFNQHANQLCLSSVSYGELVYGCAHSARPEENLAQVESFVARLELLDFDAAAASHFGDLRAELRAAGQLIGPWDMMIAGHARSRGLILVTNNQREFQRVAGLRLENWVATA